MPPGGLWGGNLDVEVEGLVNTTSERECGLQERCDARAPGVLSTAGGAGDRAGDAREPCRRVLTTGMGSSITPNNVGRDWAAGSRARASYSGTAARDVGTPMWPNGAVGVW
jgi:hypothetical protein